MKKAYFSGNDQYGEEMFPYNDYYKPGSTEFEDKQNSDLMDNHQKDGEEFQEFEDFEIKRKDRIKKLKDILNEEKDNKEPNNLVLEPAPFYNNMYGGAPQGFEGLTANPLEFYSGSVIDEGQSVQNPYENTYQSASIKEKLLKRIALFNVLVDA